MAKTYEALKRAEEEKKRRQEKRTEEAGGPRPEDRESWSVDSDLMPSNSGPGIVDGEMKAPVTHHPSPGTASVDRGRWTLADGPIKFSPQTIEECRRMKYRILESDPKRKIKAIQFSSPRKGEGCSTVLTHFAITLASEGERVLLVDANLRSPHLHKAFKLKMENGLTDLVLGNQQLEEVIQETPYGNLRLITAGTPHSNPFMIIESALFYAHLEEMKTQVDWVLLDSPPVSSSMDPIAMAGKVDRVVIIIRSERTRWEVALDTKRKLEGGNGKILGVVLNDRRYHVPRWLYKRI